MMQLGIKKSNHLNQTPHALLQFIRRNRKQKHKLAWLGTGYFLP